MARRTSGFTLVEMLVTVVIGAVVVAASYAIYVAQSKSYMAVEDQTQALQNARVTFDILSRELRMAGFGVVGEEVVPSAGAAAITFLGDVDSDVSTVLAANAVSGALEIQVNLDDGKDIIEPGDYIFINDGANVAMIPVADIDEPYDLDGEPDRIMLGSALTRDFASGTTIVKTIETVAYSYDFGTQTLSRNGVATSNGVADFQIRFFNDDDTELVPDAMTGLTQVQRAAVRRVEYFLETASLRSEERNKAFSGTVELRNMGNRGFGADVCPPNAPSSLVVTDSHTCGRVGLSWNAPTANACDGSPAADLGGFKVMIGETSGDYFTPPFNVADDSAEETVAEDVRLVQDGTYYVSVLAYDTSFNESDLTTETTFTLDDTTRPDPPAQVDATAAQGAVTLAWQDSPSEDVSGYRVYRSTDPGFSPSQSNMLADENSLNGETDGYVDSTVAACTTYYYRVAAVDCVGEGEASAATFGDGGGSGDDSPTGGYTDTTPAETTPTPPAAVDPFGATAVDQAVRLGWTNPADADFDHVTIRWSTSYFPGTMSQGSELTTEQGQPGEAMTYEHNELTNGQLYYYSIWSCDRCGSCTGPTTKSATPSAAGPVVEITAPAEGTVVTDGQLRFQARGYDPDESTLSATPNVNTDNGKGIVSMLFNVTPDPGTYQFPHSEFVKEYCGLGGDTNPCPAGDVSHWCSGDYNLWVVAVDNESLSTQSPYRTVTIDNGGIEIDPEYAPNAGGTHNQLVNLRVKNTTSVTATIASVSAEWDRATARLAAVRIPSTTTVWQPGTGQSALASPAEVEISGTPPSVNADDTLTVQLEFTRASTKLATAALSGATSVTVASASGITAGDVLYIGNTTLETKTVASKAGNTITLSTALASNHSSGERAATTASDDDMNMNGAAIRLALGYELTSSTLACDGVEIAFTLSTAPAIAQPFQDQPAADTTMTTTLSVVQVPDYRAVPVHAQVADYSGAGISTVTVNYKMTNTTVATAPSSGYATVAASFDSGQNRWEGTIPSASGKRVWVYWTAADGLGATARAPSSGAYVYEFTTDTTAPSCPLGLVATALAKKEVFLRWAKAVEDDVAGYNIFRQVECAAWGKKYTLVGDSDAGSPDTIEYTDTWSQLNTDSKCYGYYIEAQDFSGNKSSSCSIYFSQAGDCPCP